MGLAYIEGAGGGGVRSSDVTASAADILSGKTDLTAQSDDEVVQGTMPNNGTVNHSLPINGSFTIAQGYHSGSGKVTQSITTKAAATYYATTSDQTIAAGQYLSGAQTIKKLTQTNLSGGNIKPGVTVKVNNGNADVFSVTGTMASKAAATYYATTSDQTIAAGQYLSGAQTISKLTQTNLSGGNIKPGVTISVNNGNTNVWSVASTMASKAAATYYATTSDQTIAANQYLTGAQTIKKLTQSGLTSGNILRGKTITINNGNANVWSVTGSNNVLMSSVVSVELSNRGTFAIKDAATQRTVNYTMYYADINPGMTPAMVFCLSSTLIMWREPNLYLNLMGNSGSAGGNYTVTGTFVNASDAPFTSTSLRVFGGTAGAMYARIFGY